MKIENDREQDKNNDGTVDGVAWHTWEKGP